MNFFSTPEYLFALADAYYPGQKRRLATVSVAGRSYQLLRVGRRLVSWVPFMDFVEPTSASPQRKRAYLPAVGLRKVSAETYKQAGHAAGEQPVSR